MYSWKKRRVPAPRSTPTSNTGCDVSSLCAGDWLVVRGQGPGRVVGRERTTVGGMEQECVVLQLGTTKLYLSTAVRHANVRRPMSQEDAAALLAALSSPLPAPDTRDWRERSADFEAAALSNEPKQMTDALRAMWARPLPRSYGDRKASDILEQVLLQELALVLGLPVEAVAARLPTRPPPSP